MSSSFQWKPGLLAVGIVALLPILSAAQPAPTTPSGQSDRVSVVYVPPNNFSFQEAYQLLRQHNALEKIKEILSPFRFPEQLTIETTECGAVNAYYQRKDFKPTVTLCYEFVKRTLDLLPNETNPIGLTPPDAAVGQFSGQLSMRSDTQHSIYSTCQYSHMRRTPPITLQHSSCCSLAKARRGD